MTVSKTDGWFDVPKMPEKEAQSAVGHMLALIEEDCAGSWPTCPRAGLICDCRLRATRALNALKQLANARAHDNLEHLRRGE